MEMTKVQPTPKGTKVSIGCDMYRYDEITKGAQYYCNRANKIDRICHELKIKVDEAKLRAYTDGSADLKAEYKAREVKDANASGRLAEMVSGQAGADFERIAKAAELHNHNAKADKQFEVFTMFCPLSYKRFVTDNDEVAAACEKLLTDEQLPQYDLHRQIAALLTEFMGATIGHASDIGDYFHLTEAGQIIPVFDPFIYPPIGNKFVEDLKA